MKALPDLSLWRKYKFVAGVDEAGRGPLAGPVVAAAVILPRQYRHPGIDDSKRLSPARREEIYAVITGAAIAYSFGIVDAATIDTVNILQATRMAMRDAVAGLKPPPQFVLIDGQSIGDFPFPYQPLIKGDTLSISIAAASILAKVRRDAIMRDFHRSYPQYEFQKHKGYPTRLHRARIQQHGTCPIHRKSFKLL